MTQDKLNDQQSTDRNKRPIPSAKENTSLTRNTAGNIIQILADLPEFVRKPMLQSRLEEFFSMDDSLRSDTIQMALSAAPSVQLPKLATLLKSWLELLAGIDSDKRLIMFQTYYQQIVNLDPPQIKSLPLAMIADVFLSIDPSKRQILTDSIHEVLLSTPNREKILRLVPDYLLSAMKLR